MSIQPRGLVDRDQGRPQFTCDLDDTPVSRIRQLVRTLLDGHQGVRRDDAVLVADELVSNAMQHGKGPRDCRLTLIDDGQGVRIEVSDTGPGQPKIRTPDTTGGRGLLLVDRLARAWGVRRHASHKTVWADMAMDNRERKRRAPHLSIAPG